MRFLAFLVFIAFILFAIFARWFFVCDILGLCQEVAVEQVDIRPKSLQLIENDTILLSGYDEFAFTHGTDSARINDNNRAFLDTLAQLMLADSSRQLSITGYFSPDEADIMAGFWENIGLARAAVIRTALLERNIDAERFDLAFHASTDSVLTQPLSFEFIDNRPTEYGQASYLFTNMTYSDANFPSNSYDFAPTEAFQNYADSIKVYMATNPGKKIRIIGHTDSDDTEKYNLELGMKRANSAREYLEGIGIDATIDIESEGENTPIRPNDTKENKQENRRINLVIE